MLDTQKEESGTVIMAVLVVLVLIMVAWGWVRAHAQTDLNPMTKPPAGSGGSIPTS